MIHIRRIDSKFYGYLNPESTKTDLGEAASNATFYGYLNPESTKTAEFR